MSELVLAFVQRIAAEYDVKLTDNKAEQFLLENTAIVTRNWKTNDPIAEMETQLRTALEAKTGKVLPEEDSDG